MYCISSTAVPLLALSGAVPTPKYLENNLGTLGKPLGVFGG